MPVFFTFSTPFFHRSAARTKQLGRWARALAIGSFLTLGLSACASTTEDYVEAPPETFYNKGINELLSGNYTSAAKEFDEVERQHPYSVWAPRAQLMAAYAHYQNNKYDDAINALDRFIQLHPGNRDVAYAYYLKGISYYEQISDVGRDQAMTQLALNALDEVVRRYPTTEYARDAKLKIDLARDHLAGKEMEIGRFYLNQGEYLAAINRFRRVIIDYQTTTHVPEALYRLVESYLALGVDSEAQATAAVLGYNYPGSQWYAESYAMLTGVDLTPQEQQGSWISRQWKKVF
jgi:outer membrane protein assembly factor BamD